MASNRLKNQHLLWRAAFGPMAENVAQLEGISQKKLWDLLVKTSRKAPEKLQVSSGLVDGLVKGIGDAVTMAQISAEDKKKMRKEKRKQ